MDKKLKQVVIPKEEAVFWMDKNGFWNNKHGKFQHKKIIDYFNSCIKKDKDGYYLGQVRDNIYEKVYFNYEDTPIFVIDVKNQDKNIILILNTKEEIALNPEKLAVKDDNLYILREDERIKFTERGLLKISGMVDFDNGKYYFISDGKKSPIKELKL